MSHDEDPFKERRKSLRLDMEKELVTVFPIDAPTLPHKFQCVCVDVSRGGLKLNSDLPLAAESHIDVLFKPKHPNSAKRRALVLRCDQQAEGWFFVALQFVE